MDNGDTAQQDTGTKIGIVNLASMRKIPEVPDMSGRLATPRRDNPFALSDWSGSNAYKTIKP